MDKQQKKFFIELKRNYDDDDDDDDDWACTIKHWMAQVRQLQQLSYLPTYGEAVPNYYWIITLLEHWLSTLQADLITGGNLI